MDLKAAPSGRVAWVGSSQPPYKTSQPGGLRIQTSRDRTPRFDRIGENVVRYNSLNGLAACGTCKPQRGSLLPTQAPRQRSAEPPLSSLASRGSAA